MAECLISFAALAVETGRPAAGARLFTAAQALKSQPGFSIPPAARLEKDYYQAHFQSLLTRREFQAEKAVVGNLSLAGALEFAREVTNAGEDAPGRQEKVYLLTPRERQSVAARLPFLYILICQVMHPGVLLREMIWIIQKLKAAVL